MVSNQYPPVFQTGAQTSYATAPKWGWWDSNPTTNGLKARYSTAEFHPRKKPLPGLEPRTYYLPCSCTTFCAIAAYIIKHSESNRLTSNTTWFFTLCFSCTFHTRELVSNHHLSHLLATTTLDYRVELAGVEPASSRFSVWCTRPLIRQFQNEGSGIRSHDRRVKSPLLYHWVTPPKKISNKKTDRWKILRSVFS